MNVQQQSPYIPVLNDIPETCKKARVSRSTIYAMIKSGTLKVTKIGKKTFITDDEIARIIVAGTAA